MHERLRLELAKLDAVAAVARREVALQGAPTEAVARLLRVYERRALMLGLTGGSS